MTPADSEPATLQRLQTIIRRDLKLGPDVPITPEMPFFGGDADMDSLDILLLLSSVEKEFGVRIPSEAIGREVFANVGTLVAYIDQHRPAHATPPADVGIGGDESGGSPAAAGAVPDDPLARLPHRDPFRFVSRLVQVKEGESAEGVWSVSGAEPFFAGHFPGAPVVPGVLIAEALAQLSGVASAAQIPGDGRLAQVDVRFERAVVPPADIVLHAKLTRAMAGLRQFEVTATVAGVVVARGNLSLSFSML